MFIVCKLNDFGFSTLEIEELQEVANFLNSAEDGAYLILEPSGKITEVEIDGEYINIDTHSAA